ncbi:MAG: hypothetical protein JW785_02690 [Acidimicrobiia bacterium]|nr:hypothetical protein [Acidimicrobiia bacterium]
MLGSAKPVSARRKWAAIAAATVIQAASVFLMLYGAVEGAVNYETAAPGPPFALGLALVPFAFIALAFGSGHPAAGGAVVVALLVAVPVALPLAALARDVVTGLAAGYGAGGVVALRREYLHSRRARIIAVVATAVYVFATLRIDAAAGVTAACLLPFVAVGVADLAVEWRAASRSRGQGPGPGE